jgi:hypothetical protein
MSINRVIVRSGLLLVGSLLLGCGGQSDVYGVGQVVPVEGQVFVQGQPLRLPNGSYGRVWFHPDEGRGNTCPQPAQADIDSEGRFHLTTRGQVGVPPGWYKVMIVATEPGDSRKPSKLRKSFVNRRYAAVETSGLAIEVVASPRPGAYDLKLTR